jgi:DNA-binding winged helix-turn-helix (wHTH) protein
MARLTTAPPHRRYRFAGFTLSPRGRVLLRGSTELPLIPRYFDLLVLLVERRQDAVHRREIFDAVWSDVVVSDSALTQAIRTIRRALGDDPREPQFIRTVSRHGYRFVCADTVEEPDTLPAPTPPAPATSPADPPAPVSEPAAADRREAALTVLVGKPLGQEDEDARRDAAETLHQLGTAAALAALDARKGHERARAHLRDSRWDVPGAAPVPLLGAPGGAKALAILFGLRLRRARRLAGERWLKASAGGALAGLVAGMLGGAVLWLGPGSRMTPTVPIVMGLLGMAVGGAGAAGIGAGLAAAEALVRSWRRLSLAVLGALGGALAGALSHLVAQWTVQGLFGRDMSPIGGGFEGLVMGGAIGLGYGLATPRPEGGMATPSGWARVRVAALTGLAGAIAALALAATGSYLGAMSLDFMARSFPGSQVSFEPISRLLGESAPGWLTRVAIGAGEGLAFGSGLAFGLTHRPR